MKSWHAAHLTLYTCMLFTSEHTENYLGQIRACSIERKDIFLPGSPQRSFIQIRTVDVFLTESFGKAIMQSGNKKGWFSE